MAEDGEGGLDFHGVLSRAGTWLWFARLTDERWQASDLAKAVGLCHGHRASRELRAEGSWVPSLHLRGAFSPCHGA